ncbi:MAG: hypothetical protein ACTSRI_20285 [Promethearchaeota archaeon]
MNSFQKKELRKALANFPWLRPIRRIMIKFYYQFRVPPAKRRLSLTFLSRLITEVSHSWLRNAVQTLIDNEENIFRFQHIPELFPKLKSLKPYKVVNESCNKLMN